MLDPEPNPAADAVKTRLGTSKAKRYGVKLAAEIAKRGCTLEPIYDQTFHYERGWRFDVAYADAKVAIEIQGAAFVAGRHHRGAGSQGDYEKWLAAALGNWIVIPITYEMARDGTVAGQLAELIDRRLYLASLIDEEW